MMRGSAVLVDRSSGHHRQSFWSSAGNTTNARPVGRPIKRGRRTLDPFNPRRHAAPSLGKCDQ